MGTRPTTAVKLHLTEEQYAGMAAAIAADADEKSVFLFPRNACKTMEEDGFKSGFSMLDDTSGVTGKHIIDILTNSKLACVIGGVEFASKYCAEFAVLSLDGDSEYPIGAMCGLTEVNMSIPGFIEMDVSVDSGVLAVRVTDKVLVDAERNYMPLHYLPYEHVDGWVDGECYISSPEAKRAEGKCLATKVKMEPVL